METTELETVLKLLDKIITSERKEIKDAFRELMIIAALTEPNADTAGPLTELLARVAAVEAEVSSLRGTRDIFGGTGGLPLRQYSFDDTFTGPWRNSTTPSGGTVGGTGKFGGSTAGSYGPITGAIAGDHIYHAYKSLTDTGELSSSDLTFKNPDFTKLWTEMSNVEEEDK